MKTLLYGGLSLALLCGSAMAQGATPSTGADTDVKSGVPAEMDPDRRPGSDVIETEKSNSAAKDKDWDDKRDWKHSDRDHRGQRHHRERMGEERDRDHGPRGDWKKDDRGDKGGDRREHRRGDRDDSGPGRYHHDRMHARMHGDKDDAGASFKFERRGASIEINCAADESTEDCVKAILPLVETIMQARGDR